jgi:hypothetical protein
MRKVLPCAWIWMSLTSICGGTPLIADYYHLNNHWELLGDFVFMRRSEVHNKRLVKDANKPQCAGQCPDFTVISNGNLVNDFDFEPGYRVGLNYIADPGNGFEMNFLYIQPWHGDKKVEGNHSLSFPFSHSNFTHDFHNASVAQAEYESHFWDLEFNYWRYFTPRRVDYFSFSGLAGLRYVHWDEEFELKMFNPPDRSSYDIHTENRIFGVQLGLDLQCNPMRWLSWEFFVKVGGMVNHCEQKTFLGDLDNTVELHDFDKQKREVGIFTDVAAEFAIHCSRHFNIHAGYQCMFFSGLALAPEQISKGATKHAGDRVYDDGYAVIHGLYVGAIFAF